MSQSVAKCVKYLMKGDKMNWKRVPEFITDNVHYVSDTGLVTKVNTKPEEEKYLKAGQTPNGYLKVSLLQDGRYKPRNIQILVLAAFVGERPYKLEIDHIDGNKTNNNLNNLEYVTSQENKLRARNLGLAESTSMASNFFGVGWHRTAERWRASFRHDGKQVYLGMFDSSHEAAKAVNEYIEENSNYRELNILSQEDEMFGKEREYTKHV